MIRKDDKLFRWGPIPIKLLAISHWLNIFQPPTSGLHPYMWPETYLLFKDGQALCISDMDKLWAAGGEVFNNLILADKEKQRIWNAWVDSKNKLVAYYQPIDKDYLKKLSNNELEKKWGEFNKIILDFWTPTIIPEMAAYGGDKVLRDVLAEEGLSATEFQKVLAILSASDKESFYQEEARDLLLILKTKGQEFEAKLKAHQAKYFWIANSYYETKILDLDFFKEKVEELKKAKVDPDKALQDIKADQDKIITDKKKVLSKLKQTEKIKKISDNLSYCVWWQDHRKGDIFKYLHYITLFLDEFYSRTKLAKGLFDFAWYYEVSFNPSQKLVEELRKRKSQAFTCHFLKSSADISYDKDALKIFSDFWETKKKSVKEFKGIVASHADQPIRAKVFVIRTVEDIKKFPKDHILVAAMTAPEYVTAIKKSRAIITDTGGLTCHAAIVSREFKLPCIVGTKVATQALETGDLVEVDSSKGIVRKLSTKI